jgi:hypothetical protein
MESRSVKRLRSVIAPDLDHCMITGSTDVERHHVFHGTHNQRMLCEEYGFIAPLRRDLHQNGEWAVHNRPNGALDTLLKVMCQRRFEAEIGTREEFIEQFGKNYL